MSQIPDKSVLLVMKQKREILAGGENPLLNEVSSEEDIPEKLIQEEERKQLLFAIQRLPLKSKEILIESIYFHMDDEQIAKSHGITRENVRKIRSRAKQKLIEMMKEES